jgi:hypothetical protein
LGAIANIVGIGGPHLRSAVGSVVSFVPNVIGRWKRINLPHFPPNLLVGTFVTIAMM